MKQSVLIPCQSTGPPPAHLILDQVFARTALLPGGGRPIDLLEKNCNQPVQVSAFAIAFLSLHRGVVLAENNQGPELAGLPNARERAH